MQKRTVKHFVAIFFITTFVILMNGKLLALYIWAGFNAVLLTFNLLVRRSLAFKPWFLSKFNIFSANFSREFEVEIPADLAFDKILEVAAESGFKLAKADKDKLEILAISTTSWKSWGENIYFKIEENAGQTVVRFDSAAIFGIYTWGKNEDNYSVFFEKLEDSFTI